jgi:hypothetical protein
MRAAGQRRMAARTEGRIGPRFRLPSMDRRHHRACRQGTYLLGTDVTERHKKFAMFRLLYDARSKAAHTGTLSAELQARLPEFDEICTAAIRAIIDRQQFPNWNELTLGSGSS